VKNLLMCLSTLDMLRRLLFELGLLFENSMLNVLVCLVLFSTKYYRSCLHFIKIFYGSLLDIVIIFVFSNLLYNIFVYSQSCLSYIYKVLCRYAGVLCHVNCMALWLSIVWLPCVLNLD
jgi:hypothetical protein